MKKAICVLSLSFSFFLPHIQVANAQTDDFGDLIRKSKSSLNGLEVSNHEIVCLIVNLQGTKAKSFGLTEESIRTKCELRLRQAGFKPVRSNEFDERLIVGVGILSGGGVFIHSQFRRAVVFVGKRTTYRIRATTWQKVDYGTHGDDLGFVMISIDKQLDSFFNEYLKANTGK